MDTIFKALADPARRTLLDVLRKKDGQSLSDLEAHLDMSRFGVMKHLGVLEDANLITTKKVGRYKHHFLNAAALQEVVDRWIEPYRAKPAARALLDLKSQLEGTLEMTAPAYVNSTYIRCSQDKLWDALMNPDAVAHFHFMATSAKLDDDNRLTMFTADGAELMSQKLISQEPKSKMETTFEPNWAPCIPASRLVYLVEAEGDYCKLTVEHYDVEGDTSGYQDGWARWAAGFKTWLETGEDAHFGSAGNA